MQELNAKAETERAVAEEKMAYMSAEVSKLRATRGGAGDGGGDDGGGDGGGDEVERAGLGGERQRVRHGGGEGAGEARREARRRGRLGARQA